MDAALIGRLVALAQRGDRRAADHLVREHDGWVRSAIYAVVGRPDLVDDIAQQVWLRVWERLDTLQNPARLRPWLYAIARRTALDMHAEHERHRSRATSLAAEAMALEDSPSQRRPPQTLSEREQREALLAAVRGLPAIYREPLALRHLQDWSYAEIAELLGISVETVETRLVRARALLRESLEGRVPC